MFSIFFHIICQEVFITSPLKILNNSIDFLKDIDSCPTRKLIYICDQLKIPLPMRPTKEILIKSIRSFFSNSKTNKKEKTPKEKPKIKYKSHFFETPKIFTNKESNKEDNLPTPIYNPYSSSNSSCIQSRSPSLPPILPQTKNYIPKNRAQERPYYQFMLILLIILLICLILFIFVMFVV